MLQFWLLLHYINGHRYNSSPKGGESMKSEYEIICKFDSCIKNALEKELKYRIRSEKNHYKRYTSIYELSPLEENEISYSDEYPSLSFGETLTTRLFDTVIHNELLYEALLSIKPHMRELLLLKYWGSYTDEQVGEILNMNRAAITRSKNNALFKLRKIIEELSDNET